jgi:sugar lactone lactonase YvrE
MSQSVKNLLAARARLGECPVWDADRQQLFWVDVYNHRVHQFDPATGHDRYFDTGDLVSAIALAGSDRLLIALRDRLAFLNTIGSISEAPGQAALYRYDPDGSLHVMETGLTISNGLGWSPDGSTRICEGR